jgi:uncharacterized protein (DUF1800 family)
MALILADGAPLRERVTLMWHDHFATSNEKVDDVRLMYAQNQLFRDHGLGDFRALLHAIAKDPAMLLWLDGNANRRGHPNENFAREVLELFALGIGNYSEHDVLEAARCFTGWGVQGRGFTLRTNDHDAGVKELFGRHGSLTGEDAIDAVLDHPACTRWVARKLLEEFVAPVPEPTWIAEVAQELVDRDWSIEATLRTILNSTLFFGPEARRSRIAGPVEFVAIAVHVLGARVSPTRASTWAAEMGQSLLRPPSVKGWPGMRQWINAGTWIARHNAMTVLVRDLVDPNAALGLPCERAETAAYVVDLLLPDVDEPAKGHVVDSIERACSGSASEAEALRLALALVLTSSFYQRV